MKKLLLIAIFCIVGVIVSGQTRPSFWDLKDLPVVYPEQFWAKGDGIVDYSAAIASAVAAVANTGGVVRFGPKTYLTDPITIAASNVSFVGAGIDATTIKLKPSPSGTHANAIRIGDTDADTNGSGIYNLTVDGGRGVAPYNEFKAGVMICEAENWTVENVKIKNAIGYPIWIGNIDGGAQGSDYGLLKNCIIEAPPSGAAVAFTAGSHNEVSGNKVGGTIDLENNPDQPGVVNFNKILNNTGLASIADGPADTYSDLQITLVSAWPAGSTKAPTMVGNIISGNHCKYLELFNSADMLVSNNNVSGDASPLVKVTDVHNSTISANVFSTTEALVAGDILKTNGCTDLNVLNNMVNNGIKSFHSYNPVISASYSAALNHVFSNNLLSGTGNYRVGASEKPTEKAVLKVESDGLMSQPTTTLVSGNLSKIPSVTRSEGNFLVSAPSVGGNNWSLSVLPTGALATNTLVFDYGMNAVVTASSTATYKLLTLYSTPVTAGGASTVVPSTTGTCTFFLDITY